MNKENIKAKKDKADEKRIAEAKKLYFEINQNKMFEKLEGSIKNRKKEAKEKVTEQWNQMSTKTLSSWKLKAKKSK